MKYSLRKLELVALFTSEEFVYEIPRQLQGCIQSDFILQTSPTTIFLKFISHTYHIIKNRYQKFYPKY